MIQDEVDEIYDLFKERVAEGRKMSKEKVDILARGRVWTGKDALSIGLVDKLGGIEDAINYAADKAKIKTKKVLYYPLKKDDKWMALIEQLEDENEEISIEIEAMPEELVREYQKIKRIEDWMGIQMRLPYEIELK